MKAGLILIGDELLNGSRQDRHMAKAITLLKARGMQLAWVRIIADNEKQLVETFTQTFATDDIVFSFGGIGATPDDLTRACVAKASQTTLIRHPEAVRLIETRFGEKAYPNRILMAELPENASIIPNPINNVPGFSVQHHHCLPGFPDMAWPMMEWVLDTHYTGYFSDTPDVDWRWHIFDTPESELLDMMKTLIKTFDGIAISSLPSTQNRKLIDFGLKGPETSVKTAAEWLENYLQQHAIHYQKQAR
jgi:molybdopterin-biosynthesis enzyme MoeA-like protein